MKKTKNLIIALSFLAGGAAFGQSVTGYPTYVIALNRTYISDNRSIATSGEETRINLTGVKGSVSNNILPSDPNNYLVAGGYGGSTSNGFNTVIICRRGGWCAEVHLNTIQTNL
jgi:hypothetical protein